MEAGALNLKLMADITDLVSKMDQAKNTVNGSMDSMEKAFGVAKNAFIGLVGIGSVGAFAGMITSSIEATGKLHDLAIQTGASEAALGEFRKMGAYTETSADTIANAMNKLGKNMALSTIDSKGAAVAIQALGIDFNTLKSMSPEDQMMVIAQSMNKFADGADKGAVAQALFGKEGAKLLPFMKDLGDGADDITASLTEEQKALKKLQGDMADAFGDNLQKAITDSGLWKKELAMGMMPALYEVSQAFVDVGKSTSGLKGEISTLSKDGTITDWTRNLITGITYLMDVFSGLATVVKSTGLIIDGVMASVGEKFTSVTTAINQAVHGDFAGAMATMEASTRAQASITQSLNSDLDATWSTQTLGSKLRERMADLKGTTDVMKENGKAVLDAKAKLDALEAARKAEAEATKAAEAAAKAHAAELKKQEDQYIKLVSSIDEKILSDTLALESNGKLTEADKIEIKLLADLANSNIILTDAQLETALGKINLLRQTEALIDAQKREKKETEDAAKEYVALIEKLQKGTDATTAQIDKQRESNDTLGLNREELALLSIQKDLDTAATWDQKAAWAEQNGLGADLVEQYTSQATALRTLAGLKEQGIHVKAAVDARIEWERTTKAIGDGLSSALTDALFNGRSLWDAFKAYLINSILEGAIKRALSTVIQDGLNSMFGTSLFSSAGSSAAGSVAGSAVTGGGIVSGVGSAAGSAASLLGSTSMGTLDIAGVSIGGSTAAAATGTTASTAVLGAETAATTTGSIIAAAAPVAVFVAASLIAQRLIQGDGPRPFEEVGGGSLSGLSLTRNQELETGSVSHPVSSVTYSKVKMLDDGSFLYGIFGDNFLIDTVGASDFINTYHGPASAVSFHGAGGTIGAAGDMPMTTLQSVLAELSASYDAATLIAAANRNWGISEADVRLTGKSLSLPGFYAGGMFEGGLRIVGERGPELEATGPSRIFDAQTTASMLRSGGANNDEVVAELRAMRGQLAQLQLEARRTADATNGNPEAPMLTEVVV